MKGDLLSSTVTVQCPGGGYAMKSLAGVPAALCVVCGCVSCLVLQVYCFLPFLE